MQQLTDSLIVEFVEKFLAEQAKIESEFDWTPPEPPPMPPSYGDNSLTWRPSNLHYDNSPKITIEKLRRDLPQRLINYISSPLQKDQPILLTLISAGGGKTHAGVLAAQWAAQNGYRMLWCAPNHDLFDELTNLRDAQGMSIFDPSLWLHFQSLTRNEEYCRYTKAQQSWLKRGYPAMSLCRQLCESDGWIRQCPYRCQARSKKPIVFGMHQHLTTGMMLSDFDVVIIDELPLGAFAKPRRIPVEGIDIGADGRIGQLTDMLGLIARACQKNETYSGRKLFDLIGQLLTDVYQEVKDIGIERKVEIPIVSSPFDVENQPYWYIMDLLFLSLREHKAWQMQWPNWAERIKINDQGLWLLDRNLPWSQLPQKTIVLDATAEPALYAQIFGHYETKEIERDVQRFDQSGETIEKEKTKETIWIPRQLQTYQPRIDRKGKVYQIVARMNGKRSLVNKSGEYTKNAQVLIEQTKLIAKKYEGKGRVCVVCHLIMKPKFVEIFGDENVLHFGAIRGSNKLEKGLACLIVAGTPAPSPFDIVDIAVALDQNRIEPFRYAENPKLTYIEQECEYRITPELRYEHGGEGPFRKVRGYWDNWQLQAIHEQLSKAELEQAIHRARINSQEADVWNLSGLPTNEPVDGIWDELPLAPDPFTWQEWALIEPWLNARWENGECVGRANMAAVLGISQETVRRRHLLQSLLFIQEGRWTMENDPEFAYRGGAYIQRLKPITW